MAGRMDDSRTARQATQCKLRGYKKAGITKEEFFGWTLWNETLKTWTWHGKKLGHWRTTKQNGI